jgi:hypothetical protein
VWAIHTLLDGRQQQARRFGKEVFDGRSYASVFVEFYKILRHVCCCAGFGGGWSASGLALPIPTIMRLPVRHFQPQTL